MNSLWKKVDISVSFKIQLLCIRMWDVVWKEERAEPGQMMMMIELGEYVCVWSGLVRV